jgi:hypothetical protein
MRHAWIALAFALTLHAQDEKKDDLKRLAEDAAQALRQTAKPGSFEFAGILKTEVNPEENDAEPTECKLSGAAGTPFHSAFKAKTDSATHDIVFKGGKMAGRLTWKGHPLDLGKAPGEVLSLINLERLAIYVEKATAAKALPDAKPGGEDCRVLELVLPKETMRSHHEDAEAAEEEEKSVENVEIRLHVRKSDGLVVKLEATVHRLYKDEDNPDDTSKGRSEYALTLKEFGTAKVKIPAGLEKLIKD